MADTIQFKVQYLEEEPDAMGGGGVGVSPFLSIVKRYASNITHNQEICTFAFLHKKQHVKLPSDFTCFQL